MFLIGPSFFNKPASWQQRSSPLRHCLTRAIIQREVTNLLTPRWWTASLNKLCPGSRFEFPTSQTPNCPILMKSVVIRLFNWAHIFYSISSAPFGDLERSSTAIQCAQLTVFAHLQQSGWNLRTGGGIIRTPTGGAEAPTVPFNRA